MTPVFTEVLTWPLLWLAVIVFGAYTTQAMTGFGSIIIALALGAHLYPLQQLLPVLVALNVPLCLYLVIRHRRHLQGRLLVTEILPWMGLGLGLGVLLAGVIRGQWLEQLFGLLVVVLASRELWRLRAPRARPAGGLTGMRLSLGGAGIVHGLYASGGPLLVHALGRRQLPPAAMRCTLMTVWLIFNSTLLVIYVWRGQWTQEVLAQTLWLLPLIPPGVVLGEWLHARVSVRGFYILLQVLLVISGLALMVGTTSG